MKKVAIDARESGTSTGRYVDKLVEHLAKLEPGYEIIVLAKPHRVDYLQLLAPKFQVVESDHKEFTFDEQLGFRRQLEQLKPDLVHFTMPQQPVWYSGRTVTTIHDLITIRFNNPAKNPLVFKFKQQVYKFVVRKAVDKASKVIAISEYTKKDLTSFSGVDQTKVKVIYEAADKITEPPLAIDELVGEKFLLYVGRPNPHKNLCRLIEAFEKIAPKHPGVKLVLAGKTDENYKKQENLVNEKNLASQVFFTGFVGEGSLRWLYENALAYALPSLAEGFGLPGLEAMHYSLPVVSSNAACLPEIYKDAALYFDPTSVPGIADKLDEVIDDSGLREDLASRGLALLKQYSWQKMAAQTLEVYKSVLG